jgi:glycosyltransferase involved in cell wall biosynthesis
MHQHYKCSVGETHLKTNNDNLPKISIITPSYNQGKYIEDNIQSVLNQNYINFEHIIIDGGSTDNTVEILKKYPHLKWVSESDEGQSDALNKGLAMSTGEIIGWINSDDYYEIDIFHDVSGAFKDSSVQWVVGLLKKQYDDIDLILPRECPEITYNKLIENPDIVNQQCTFYRKSAIENIGGWKKELYMVMDYDLWIRLSKQSAPLMVQKDWAYFRYYDGQKTSYENILIQAREIQLILKKEGVSFLKRKWFLVKRYKYVLKGRLKSLLIRFGFISKTYSGIPLRLHKKKGGIIINDSKGVIGKTINKP